MIFGERTTKINISRKRINGRCIKNSNKLKQSLINHLLTKSINRLYWYKIYGKWCNTRYVEPYKNFWSIRL